MGVWRVSGLLVLLAQGCIYFTVLAAIFYYRKAIGVGVFFCVLGAMHFLETYLAAVYFIVLPFGLISPGSTVMFTGKLAFFLLLYIKEDAESMRQPIYGLLAGNMLMVVLTLVLRFPTDLANLSGYPPDLRFLDQIGFLMIWGSVLLFVDLIVMVLLYERLGRLLTNAVFARLFVSLAIVLTFDQIAFYAGLRIVNDVPVSAFYGGWIAKIGAVCFFSGTIALYLRFAEENTARTRSYRAADVFDRLTYRQRYEELVEQVGKDPLTGLQDRGRFDIKGPDMLRFASRTGCHVSLMMIDIDHFKSINDEYGHPQGDRVIRDVAEAIVQVKREGDELFRYGGEEFALLCLEPPQGAAALSERVREAVAGLQHLGLGRSVTVSIGIATYPTNARDFPRLLRKADAALYAAKSRGRNASVSASEMIDARAVEHAR